MREIAAWVKTKGQDEKHFYHRRYGSILISGELESPLEMPIGGNGVLISGRDFYSTMDAPRWECCLENRLVKQTDYGWDWLLALCISQSERCIPIHSVDMQAHEHWDKVL